MVAGEVFELVADLVVGEQARALVFFILAAVSDIAGVLELVVVGPLVEKHVEVFGDVLLDFDLLDQFLSVLDLKLELQDNGVVVETRQQRLKGLVVLDEILPLLKTHEVLLLVLVSGVDLHVERRVFVDVACGQQLVGVENPNKRLDSLVSLLVKDRVLGDLNPHFVELSLLA